MVQVINTVIPLPASPLPARFPICFPIKFFKDFILLLFEKEREAMIMKSFEEFWKNTHLSKKTYICRRLQTRVKLRRTKAIFLSRAYVVYHKSL